MLTELFLSNNAPSVIEKINLIPWGEIFDEKDFFWIAVSLLGSLLGLGSSLFAIFLFIKKNVMKVFSPYKEYINVIDRTMGRSVRKNVEHYYVPTRGQDEDPCFEDEIYENNGKYLSIPLIPFLRDKAFAPDSFGKHYMILADSGMGKTTFLIRLYREYVLKPSFPPRDKLKIVYISLSHKKCMDYIQEINQPEKTILLLDALDENADAICDAKMYLKQLLAVTEKFNKVVITCRTQFFPSKESEPESTELVTVGVGNKSSEFIKKYITPFNEEEVEQYLRKRFRFKPNMRKEATKIVRKVPEIMARPLILNWIDCLVDDKGYYEYTFQIYRTIISKWIEREPSYLTNGKLHRFSVRLAKYMLANETTAVPSVVVEKMAQEDDIAIQPIVAQSRSLLNRNSDDEYKFAHRSFLEYFLASSVYYAAKIPNNESFLHSMSGFRVFFDEYITYAVFDIQKWTSDSFMSLNRFFAEEHQGGSISQAFGSTTIRVYSVKNTTMNNDEPALAIKIAFIPKYSGNRNNEQIHCAVCSFLLRKPKKGCALIKGAQGFRLNVSELYSLGLTNMFESSTNVFHVDWGQLPTPMVFL